MNVHAIPRSEVREIKAVGPGIVRVGAGRPPRLNGVFGTVKRSLCAQITSLEAKRVRLDRQITRLREASAVLDAVFPTS